VRIVLRLVLTVVMDALLLIAGLLLARIVIEFFGQLASVPLANQLKHLSDIFLPSLGFSAIPTPYHGKFDVDAAAVLVGVLAVEWVVAFARRLTR